MYSLYSLVIGIGFLTILPPTTIASNENTGKFQKIIYTLHDQTVITNLSCYVKPINRYTTVAGGYAFFSRPVHHLMVHAKVYKKFNVVYKPFLVDVTENVCDALGKNAAVAPYSKIALQIAKPYLSLNHPCPFEGWVTVSQAVLDLSQLRLVVPKGEYRVDVIATLNKSPNKTITVQVFAEVGEK